MRRLALALGLVVAAAAVACSASQDDGAVTGDDQNIEEMPCAPFDTITCHPGYHTISLLGCPKGQGRCSVDACEPSATLRCVDGYAPTSTHCKGKSSARCAPVNEKADGGAGDAGHDASRDAPADARRD
jgi:hypothetical protein